MLSVVRVVIGVLGLAKTAMLTTIGVCYSINGLTAVPVALVVLLGTLMVASLGLFTVGRSVRLAATLASVGFLVFILPVGIYNHHTYLLAVIFAIFSLGTHTALLLKLQLTLVYFFAAITKLNESFLSGSELYVSVVVRPFWQATVGADPGPWILITLAAAAIVVELFLAFGFWFKQARWAALIVGVGFHMLLLVTMTNSLRLGLDLMIFGGVFCALYILFFEREVDELLSRRRRRALDTDRMPA